MVKQFLEKNDYHKLIEKLVVIRQDGITLYSNLEDSLEASSIGALVSGVWQAAQALSEITHHRKDYVEFRLGFDTSSEGLYVLPLSIKENTYYLGGIYTNQNNPAKLKQSLRLLKNNLEQHLEDSLIDETVREGFLFDNISDDEMNKLFSFDGV